jgi:glycine reductase
MRQAGTGITLALKGAAVLVTESNDIEAKCRSGAILDMSGPIAAYTPLSQTYNLIIDVKVNCQRRDKFDPNAG